MSIFQQQKLLAKVFYSWSMFVFVVIVILITINQILSFYNKDKVIQKKLNDNREKLQILELELDEKSNSYDFLISDRGNEEYLRKVFPLAKDGEKIIILYNPTTTPLENVATTTDFWTNTKKKFIFFIDKYTNL